MALVVFSVVVVLFLFGCFWGFFFSVWVVVPLFSFELWFWDYDIVISLSCRVISFSLNFGIYQLCPGSPRAI